MCLDRQTVLDKSQSCIFMLWKYLKQRFCCYCFTLHMPVARLQQEFKQAFSGSGGRGKIWHYKKVSFLFPSPLPEAWCNTCLISRGTRKGWASRHLRPKILHASFFIHAACNVPSLAQLHLNTLVLPNTWLDFPLSKWKISIICFLRIQQMREFMTNCVGLCRIVIIRYKWEFFA